MYRELVQAAPTHIFTLQLVFDSFREHQELIEKFESRYKVATPGGKQCVYCGAEEYESHKSDCPYAIRERMGYGGQD